MDYQQLPSATTLSIGNGLQNQHVQQLMQNSVINNVQIISSMQPPPVPVNNNIPLSVVHNLPHLTGNTNQNTNNNNSQNNNHHNSQNLPPPSQLLQLHHHNNNNNNNTPNNNNNTTEESNRWTQFQVQQLWRHHAYLNGKAIRLFAKIQTVKSFFFDTFILKSTVDKKKIASLENQNFSCNFYVLHVCIPL